MRVRRAVHPGGHGQADDEDDGQDHRRPAEYQARERQVSPLFSGSLDLPPGAELAASGIAPSVGTAGDSYDNALAESIIGLYKTEVIDHLGPWETPARVEAATSEWASWYNTARVMRRTGGRPPGEYEQAWRDGTLGQVPARGPGSRPGRPPEGGGHGRRALPRRAPPAPAGAPPRTPALLRDAPAGHDGCGGRRVSPRRPRDGCHGTPAQVKGASGVAGDNAEASPLTSPGNPRRNAGCPTRRCPTPPGRPGGRSPPTRRGSWTAQLDRCSINKSGKMIRPWFRQAAVPWKTTVTQTRASGENRVSTKLGVLQRPWAVRRGVSARPGAAGRSARDGGRGRGRTGAGSRRRRGRLCA